MTSTVDRYFELVDIARSDELLDQFVDLFTPDAELVPAGQEPLHGRAAIRANQAAFYTDVSAASKHYYVVTSQSEELVEADWAVAALMRNGELFTLQSHNVYELADDGRIHHLTVTNI